MTFFGQDMRLTVDRELRGKMRSAYSAVQGCTRTAVMQDLDVFRLRDGYTIGIYYVDSDEVRVVEARSAVSWQEFVVDDLEGRIEELSLMGLEPLEGSNREQACYRSPGGQLFRLTARSRRTSP